MTSPRAHRRAELAAALAAVEDRLAAACAAAGRDRSEVLLVAVTKTFPASDVALLAGLGVTDVAENRDQEAVAKVAEVPSVRWHLVGRLQRNKCRSVARWAATVHSVDRPELVVALDRAARDREQPLDVLVQVSLDEPPGAGTSATEAQHARASGAEGTGVGRGGVVPAAVPGLVEAVLGAPALRLRGVMAVAPQHGNPAHAFARLGRVAETVRTLAPGADVVSAGMSGDLEDAVLHGSTLVRVGTALLGRRPPPGR